VLRRRPGQALTDLDAVDVRPEQVEHRRLVARAGADLEDPVPRVDLQRLAHQRDDVRLADGLRLTDGKGLVLRGDVSQSLRHEVRARQQRHRGEHALVPNAAPAQPHDEAVVLHA